jgi:hypothetical protein
MGIKEGRGLEESVQTDPLDGIREEGRIQTQPRTPVPPEKWAAP